MIIDSSVLLSAFFPDEAQEQAQRLLQDHVTGVVWLVAPTLIHYEICNAVLVAERRGRIDSAQSDEILALIARLEIETHAVPWTEILPITRQCGCSAYDGAYLALAQARNEPFITGDERLARKAQPILAGILHVQDY